MSNCSILHMYFSLDKVFLSCAKKYCHSASGNCLICALNKNFKISIGDSLGDLKLCCLRDLIHEQTGSKNINTHTHKHVTHRYITG